MTNKLRIALFLAAYCFFGTATLQAEPLYFLGSDSHLYVCDSDNPSTCTFNGFSKVIPITDGGTFVSVQAIDFRPATGTLYGLSQNGVVGRIYQIDHTTGAATLVGNDAGFQLTAPFGRSGFDFDPTTDRIRITTENGQNLSISPDDGTATTGTHLAYAANDINSGKTPEVSGSAYTNNFSGAQATTLYGIDLKADVLVVQHPADSGTLRTVATLGPEDGSLGFDVSGLTGTAYYFDAVGVGGLHKIDLVTGERTFLANVIMRPNFSISPRGLATMVNPPSRLLNIATRGRVGTGDDVLIGGFVSRAGARSRYLLRAIGPSLSGAGINAALTDPVLTLYDKNGVPLLSNDDWKSSQETEINRTTLAPAHEKEPAILASLAPDSYTAIVSGKEGATGVAVVEIYQLP